MSNLENFSSETVLKFLRDVNAELKPTHEKLCYPILERIYKKMCVGIYFSGIKVYEDIIIEVTTVIWHHYWRVFHSKEIRQTLHLRQKPQNGIP